MPLTTYDELQTAVGTWLNRSDLSAVIPDFIALADAQIARDVRHWRMEVRATTTIDSRYTTLPTYWVRTLRLHIGDAKAPLQLLSLADMQDMRYANGDTQGEPKYYAHVAGEFEVYPTPGDSYTGELLYHARPIPLSDTQDSNWLLEYAPDVYLYGTLVASAPFLQHDERTATWASLYAAAVQRLNAEGEAAQWSGTGLKMRGRL